MSDGDYNREELLYLARLAEQCDRFDGKSIAKLFMFSIVLDSIE